MCDTERWGGGVVHYVPYIGADYFAGLAGGARLLLVGESHYEKKGLTSEESKKYTLSHFGEYVDLSLDLKKDSTFFKRVGKMPTLKEDASREAVAEVWRRVAFTNFLQGSVGDKATDRPNKDLWDTGERALREIVSRLEPDAVLFISKSVWDRVGYGTWSAEPPIAAERCSRRLWLFPHGAGEALCTWVYHPSWNFETQASRIKVLIELLRLAKKIKAG
ncbi:hypothetical protein [Arenimonas metalli]|uniref:hypothetical protein n=1 Tax=Arenimonas metalli TaxID=948077 RepID=UPI0012EC6273|nr:hypothetical protein [Arenimonas metalli]